VEQQLRRLEMDDVSDRKNGLGGSDSPIILNVSPFKTRKQLWQEKLGLVEQQEESPIMKRGHYMEDKVADMYEGITGLKTRKILQRILHPKYPHIFAHVDRVIEGDKRGPGILEIKCPGSMVSRKIMRDGMQDYYIIQLQHYLAVTGYKWGALVAMDYDNWKLVPYEARPDKDLIDIIISEDNKFWEYVKNGEEPPEPEVKIEVSDETRAGEVVNMEQIDPQLWAALVKEYGIAKAISDEAEATMELAEKNIKIQMDAAGANVAEGAGARFYWRNQPGRMGLDKKAFAKGSPQAYEIYESYMNPGKPSRPFRAYFPKPIYRE
jgi:putative phage-type endonuclease